MRVSIFFLRRSVDQLSSSLRTCYPLSGPMTCRGRKTCNGSCVSRTGFCLAHGGGQKCAFEGCVAAAAPGWKKMTGKCISHGGGALCVAVGCRTSVTPGIRQCCVQHGGARPCHIFECVKSALDASDCCADHQTFIFRPRIPNVRAEGGTL